MLAGILQHRHAQILKESAVRSKWDDWHNFIDLIADKNSDKNLDINTTFLLINVKNGEKVNSKVVKHEE
jgi:hypothetical protein